MKKILLDECTPRVVKQRLPTLPISTVQEMGWKSVKNGPLLRLAEANFDIFITTDQNLRHQQNLTGRHLAIIVLPSNQVPVVVKLLPAIEQVIQTIQAGELVEIPLPTP